MSVDEVTGIARDRRDSGHTILAFDWPTRIKLLKKSYNSDLSDLIESVESQGWHLDVMTRQGDTVTAVFRLGVDRP